ncbi:MAG: hypothetical protein J5I91_05175 [Bacteroidetes bacterium]|nr:hypothetical protein [Bacteroidota bacterium]
MKLKLLFLFGMALLTSELKAWEGGFVLGAKAASLGNCGLTHRDLWSVNNNPATMSFNEKSSFGISVQNRFGVTNLNAGAVGSNLISDYGCLGFYAYSFGNSAYYQYSSGLSFSKRLAQNFAMGISLCYTGLYVKDYGEFGTPIFNLGFTFPFNKNFIGAFKINNPTKSKISQFEDERTQSSAALGFSHKVAANTYLYTEAEIYEKYPLDLRCGIEYSPISNYAVRAGFSTLRSTVTFGFSIEKSIKILIGFSYHNRLGFSSTFDSQIYFGKTTEQ